MNGFIDRFNGAARRIPTWVVYSVLLVPALWLFYKGVTGDLGADPVKSLRYE